MPVASVNGKVKRRGKDSAAVVKPPVDVPAVCLELQSLQRQRAIIIKSRIMQYNRLVAIVAGELGFTTFLSEKERSAKFDEARAKIKEIAALGDEPSDFVYDGIVKATLAGVESFDRMQQGLEERMIAEVVKLPIADGPDAWINRPEQSGFGVHYLAVILGETGCLDSYTNPAKVWKRLGCAPHTFEGKTAMGATWRAGKEGKLPKEEWEKFGYSPRRRSVSYLLGELIVKMNGPREGKPKKDGTVSAGRACGPYRKRYDEVRERVKETHPEWTPKRQHLHAMLLATKLALKNLWVEWRKTRGTYTTEGIHEQDTGSR